MVFPHRRVVAANDEHFGVEYAAPPAVGHTLDEFEDHLICLYINAPDKSLVSPRYNMKCSNHVPTVNTDDITLEGTRLLTVLPVRCSLLALLAFAEGSCFELLREKRKKDNGTEPPKDDESNEDNETPEDDEPNEDNETEPPKDEESNGDDKTEDGGDNEDNETPEDDESNEDDETENDEDNEDNETEPPKDDESNEDDEDNETEPPEDDQSNEDDETELPKDFR